MTTTVALAKRPFTKEEGVLDILGHKAEKGAAAGAALEAAAAAGSRGAGVGLDGSVPPSQSQSQSQSQGLGSSQDVSGGWGWMPRVGESESQQSFGESARAGAGAGTTAGRQQRRVKSQAEVWASALMKIDGCSEGTALAIVRAHPTMAGLMARRCPRSHFEWTRQLKAHLLVSIQTLKRNETMNEKRVVVIFQSFAFRGRRRLSRHSVAAQYASTSLTEAQKKNLLADLHKVVTTHSGQGRRVGPAVSARVYEVLRPRDPDDAGDAIVGLGVAGG